MLAAGLAGLLTLGGGCGAREATTLPMRDWVSGSFTNLFTEGSFIRSHFDDSGHLTYLIGQRKQHPPTATGVWVIGGSSVRECMQDPADLQRALAADGAGPTAVTILGSSFQTFAQALAMIDNIPAGKNIIMLGVHHTSFAFGLGAAVRQLWGNDLLMQSPSLRRFVAEAQGGSPSDDIAKGVAAYVKDYEARRDCAFSPSAPPLRYSYHRYNQGRVEDDATKRTDVQSWLTGRGRAGGVFFTNIGEATAMLAACLARAKERGFTVVVMETPLNAAIVGHSFDRYQAIYRPACRSLARRYGDTYVDVNRTAGLVDSDFHDLNHLVESGRTKWTQALADALAPLVPH